SHRRCPRYRRRRTSLAAHLDLAPATRRPPFANIVRSCPGTAHSRVPGDRVQACPFLPRYSYGATGPGTGVFKIVCLRNVLPTPPSSNPTGASLIRLFATRLSSPKVKIPDSSLRVI